MIKDALQFTVNRMNTYLKTRLGAQEDFVILSALSTPDGKLAIESGNKIVVTLANIEPEKVLQVNDYSKVSYTPSLSINLYILVSAYCPPTNYSDSLRMLSTAITFFQTYPVFSSQNEPDMAKSINKLTYDMIPQAFNDHSNLWSTIGVKYIPSVLYKIRMLTLTPDNYSPEWPSIMSAKKDGQ